MDSFVGAGTPLSTNGFGAATATLNCVPESLWAVLATETSGCGFQSNKKPKILFERHIFHRLTGGKFDSEDPDISAPTPGGYGATGDNQYVRLQAAINLDQDAALQSASWGIGQIMGMNYAAAGYASVGSMVADFVISEDLQMAGMAKFIMASGMGAAISSKNWATFARLYNGPNYAANNYDGHLATFFGRYIVTGCPDITLRQAQMLLTYLGYAVGGVDGFMGPNTRAALQKFQQDQGLPVTGIVDPGTSNALLS